MTRLARLCTWQNEWSLNRIPRAERMQRYAVTLSNDNYNNNSVFVVVDSSYTYAYIIRAYNIRTDSRLRPSHDKSAVSRTLSSVYKYYNNIQFDFDNGTGQGCNWAMSVFRSIVGWADLPFGETDVFNRLA